MMQDPSNITLLLEHCKRGDEDAFERLFTAVYAELRQMAAAYMRRESAGHTLQPTALVNEAYFRLVDQHAVDWQSRSHFFGVAAQVMRRILVDQARARKAIKRGGDLEQVSLSLNLDIAERLDPDLEDLDEALTRLATVNERQCRVVELRYFVGLSIDEAAHVLGTSPATVKRDWEFARTWLHRELNSV